MYSLTSILFYFAWHEENWKYQKPSINCMLFLFLSIHHCIVSLNVFIAINTRTAAGNSLF